jgi:hypothetical protein
MGGLGFFGALTVGAAGLAVWVDCLLGARRPATALRRFIHAGVALAVLQLASVLAAHLARGAPLAQVLIAVFLLLLPSLVYAFLGGTWLIRTLADTARVAGR